MRFVLLVPQNKKLPSDVEADTGEVSDDDEEQDDTLVINGHCKLERQNSKQGSIKRQIVKVGRKVKSYLLVNMLHTVDERSFLYGRPWLKHSKGLYDFSLSNKD